MANVCNVPSRTIFTGDNLDILRGMNSECIDPALHQKTRANGQACTMIEISESSWRMAT